MAIVFKRKLLYQILFALCIGVPYLGNYELTFALWTFSIAVTLQYKYSLSFLRYTACFLAILLVAVFSTDFGNVQTFYLIRDITYLLKPVMGLVLGYQLCKYNYTDTFKTLIITGVLIAIIHWGLMIGAIVFNNATSVSSIRFYSGYFSDYEVYALIVLIFHRKFDLELSKKHYRIALIILSTSAFMYFARTHIIQFVILFAAMRGYFVLTKRSIIAVSSLIISTLIAYSVVLYINPKRNGEGLEEFLYKVKVAPIEPFKRKINKDDYVDYNDNYRSVEMNLTLRQVGNSGWDAVWFGKGLGSQVDLKRKVFLGDMELRYISVLHNAFMTVLLKAGIVGILILLYSIYILSRPARSTIPIVRSINFLIVGTAIFLLASNWVLMGYYFTQDSKSILIGLLIAYKEITIKRQMAT